MSYSTFVVRQVFKDPSKGRIIGPQGEAIEFQGNRNNIAIVDFPNDANPANIITYYMSGSDISDDTISQQAYFVIKTLNDQEAGLAAITTNRVSQPTPPDPKFIELQAKQTAYALAARDAMVKFRNDPAEISALADLKTAEAAVAQTAQLAQAAPAEAVKS